MAEQLGEASLKLTLDTKGLDAALQAAKKQIEGELGGTIQKATQKGTTTGAGSRGGITAELRASAQILRLRNSINILETKGIEVSQLRSRLLDIEASAANKQFKAVNQQSEVLRQIVSAEQNRLQVQKNITTEQNKQLQQTLKIAKQNAVPVSGVIKTAGLPAFQFPGSPGIRGSATQQAATASQTQAARSAERVAAAERKLAADREKATRAAEKAAAAERKQSAALRRDVAANALIGLGFPLLFGQGAGAALGGGLGGAAGALGGGTFGFAGSIAGTALGAAFDTAIQKAQTLAQALESPAKNFDQLREASLISSKAVEKNVQALINANRLEEANAAIRADINATFGDLSSAQAYAKAVDELNRSWSQLSVLVAAFTAGPLTQFLNRLREGLQATINLTPEERTAARRRAEEIVASQTNPLQRTGFFGGVNVDFGGKTFTGTAVGVLEDVTAAIEQQELARKRANKEDSVAIKNAKELAQAASRQAEIQSLENNLIVAQVQGNAALSYELERQLTIQTAEAKIAADRTQTLAVRRQLQKDLIQLDEKELQRQKDAEAARQVAASDMMEGIKAARLRVTAAETLAKAEQGVTRETKKQLLQIQANIQAARSRVTGAETALGAAVSAGADDTTLRQLAGQIIVAGNELDAAFVEGKLAAQEVRENLTKTAKELRSSALSLQTASLNASINLRSAISDLTAVRSDPGGLNRFLSPRAQTERALQDFQTLLPLFRQAQSTFFQLTGERAREFRGPTADVNAAIRDFIGTVDKELSAGLGVADAQINIVKTNQELAAVNKELAAATKLLTDKEWNVAVNVINQAGGSSTVNAINGLAQ